MTNVFRKIPTDSSLSVGRHVVQLQIGFVPIVDDLVAMAGGKRKKDVNVYAQKLLCEIQIFRPSEFLRLLAKKSLSFCKF